MKAILSIAVYLVLVVALGLVTALTTRRKNDEPECAEDF